MFASPLYILTTAIATVAAAAANFEGLPYQVSDLSITRVAGANVTFNFTVHDPDPVGEATQVCTSTWVVGSRGFPTEGYEPCDGSPFAWRMEAFTSIEYFTLDMEHSFQDPSVGDPPYDRVTTFAKANITLDNHPCKTSKGRKVCAQKKGAIIEAPVYAAIA